MLNSPVRNRMNGLKNSMHLKSKYGKNEVFSGRIIYNIYYGTYTIYD